MNERIKKLRKALDLTQQELADKIGVRQNTIAKYETSRGNPTTSVISLICREFHVNEAWLRTGEGEMFQPETRTLLDELAVEYHLDELDQRIMAGYLKLSEADREAVKRYVQNILDGYDAQPPELFGKTEQLSTDERIALLEQQNRELAAEIAAMKQEDAEWEAMYAPGGGIAGNNVG